MLRAQGKGPSLPAARGSGEECRPKQLMPSLGSWEAADKTTCCELLRAHFLPHQSQVTRVWGGFRKETRVWEGSSQMSLPSPPICVSI